MSNDQDALLVHQLTEHGLSWSEIELVMARLDEYERRTVRESVFDSIERGSFSLDAIITASNDQNRTGLDTD
ncbi:MAG: hypothetical protein AAGA03_00895 [Planctomycetota bacterium]